MYLDTIEGDLMVEAERLLQQGSGIIYEFRVSCATGALVSGRAAVVLQP
jgi:hypothetical protein